MAFISLKRFTRTLVFTSSVLVTTVVPVWAQTKELVKDLSGKPLFDVRFFDRGESFGQMRPPMAGDVSSWSLNAAQKKTVVGAIAQWAAILGPGSAHTAPALIHVGTSDKDNVSADVNVNHDGTGKAGYTGMAARLILNHPEETATLFVIGTPDFGIAQHASPIPVMDKADLGAVIFHEMGHALGVTSWASDSTRSLSLWDQHLYDKNNTPLQQDIPIVREADGGGTTGTVFIVGDLTRSGVTFRGAHVDEVRQDILLTVNGYEQNPDLSWSPELSHIELERGLMSHQDYRNYTTFMEAELAVLQDLGYDIDRRNFFGFSVYGDNGALINANGYFARNAAGTAYLPGQANTATLGVGLHIYGKNNDVTQAADLLAGGLAGTGARVDGSANTLRINPGTRVAADGEWGTGLLVAYGKNHMIVNRGEVRALGRGGVGARFDFGSNVMGDDKEYRGSYIRQVNGIRTPLTENDENGFKLNLDGPLAKSFDVSGPLAGRAAAVYIAENAWVQQINFMAGAEVTGNIISQWDPGDSRIQYGSSPDLHTTLTFGRLAGPDGQATATSDPTFSMTLRGGVFGGKSFDMELKNGRLDVLGPLEVYSLSNNGRLALLDADARGSTVTTDFSTGAGATLETGFTANGRVAGITAANVTLSTGSAWELTPLRDFYPSDAVITPDAPVKKADGTSPGSFASVALGRRVSPTLTFSFQSSAPTGPKLSVTRAADAYSRFADHPAAASVGRILPVISQKTSGDMKNLLTELDFSAMDGSDIRNGLTQLTPGAYDTVARESLDNQHEQNMLSVMRLLDAGNSRACSDDSSDKSTPRRCDDWTVSVHPFGRYSHVGDDGHKAGYKSSGGGLTVQAEKTARNGLTLGFEATFSERHITSIGGMSAKTRTTGGYGTAHALFKPADWNGTYLMGLARIGFEDMELERHIAINGYRRSHTGNWTGFSGSALAGIGRDWTLSQTAGNLVVGPLAWLEYAVTDRGSLTESGEGATRLHLDSDKTDAVSSALGVHAAFTRQTAGSATMKWDALAAWRHQWQNGTLHTGATFAGYGDSGFFSATDIPARNSLLAQIGFKATDAKGRFAQLSAGSEWYASDRASYYASINVGLSF